MNTAKLAPRRRLFALGTASALAIAVASPALAQDAAATDENPDAAAAPSDDSEAEIVVTGFRASLKGAQDIKRNADTFVDAITAEDIGALPDRSVEEALQRVPGVNIGRFEKPSDPDRFSVEGTGVIIRGLGFVRSELNGRDIFSANGGTVLSFNEISPELLGSVLVFKNLTADMVEGGIAGTVNLRTRKPLDRRGFHISGTLETNVGDLAEEWSPGGSVLLSNTWETDAGTLGFQFGYARSELKSRTDASQVADPCYRPATLDGACFRVRPVGSGGISNTNPQFTPDNFPPPGALVVPKGAGVRTTDLERDREAFSAALQYESPDRDFLFTFEWLRADTTFFTKENAAIALVNDDALFPVPAAGTSFEFDQNGQFVRGILSQRIGDAYANPFGRGGIPLELLRFERETRSSTEDFSVDVDWNITDRLRVNFEAQHIRSELGQDSIIADMATWANIALDVSGKVPQVQFLAPPGAEADYFTSGRNTYFWFLLDSIARNEGELDTLRGDVEYDLSEDGFFKQVKFGARWSDRGQTTRDTNFSTWGNLSAPWAGRAGCAPWGAGPGCGANGPGPLGNGFIPGRYYTGLPDQQFAIAGGAFVDDFPNYANLRTPFDNNFQRGGTSPLPGGAHFFGGDNFLQEYLAGTSAQQAREINIFSQTPNPFFGVRNRSYFNAVTRETTPCDPFCQNEISDVSETTKAAYARVDYGTDFDNGWKLTGNFGLRYIETEVLAVGEVGFPNPFFFDDPASGGNGDGVAQLAEVTAACGRAQQLPIEQRPAFCGLSSARLAEFAAAYTGEVVIDDRTVTFDNWLPSFNALLDTGNGLLFRAAVSKGISRPDLAAFRAGGVIGDNTGDLRAEGTLETGPLFQLFTGNRTLRPIESWNYDLSVEWYFDRVGSITLNAFAKDIKGIVNNGADVVDFTSPSGLTLDVEVNGPDNRQNGTLKGVEVAYQQTYDFLPGLLSGLGSQLTYTYVDGSDFRNTNLANNQSDFAAFQPLAGISKHTVNAVLFYEKDWLSARAAYNWRSAFLITPRDDIFPFSPIWGEETGQLDASIFVTVRDGLKLGVQGVNLLDEVFRTSQVIDFDGTRIQRSAFRNDRRFTFLARFDF